MYELDAAATHQINALAGRFEALDFLLIWISAIGIPIMVLAVALQWWRKTDRAHVRHVLVAAGLSFLLGLAVNQLILLFIQRSRPYDEGITNLLIERSADFSFPSDHATAAIAITAAFLLHGMKRSGWGFLVAAVLVVLSRVYLGTHYLGDVLGGAATGVLAAIVVRYVYLEGTRIDRFISNIL